jgi:HEPN domain-containing protein
MRGDENNPGDWFKLAQRDLETAELLLAHNKIEAAAAPAQQAAEKILKGKLVHLGITPPRWHNLLELRRLLPAELQTDSFTQEIAELLSEEYLASRYPVRRGNQSGNPCHTEAGGKTGSGVFFGRR